MPSVKETGPIDGHKPVLGRKTSEEMRFILDCAKPMLSYYKREGLAVEITRGIYDGDRTVRNIINHMRGMLGHRKDAEVEDFNPIRARMEMQRANLNLAQLRLDQAHGKVVAITDIKDLWGSILLAIRSMVLAWPTRCSFELPHLTAHDIQVLQREAEEVLRHNALLAEEAPLPEQKE